MPYYSTLSGWLRDGATLLVSMAVVSGLAACERFVGDGDVSQPSFNADSPIALEMSYDLETVSYTKLINPNDAGKMAFLYEHSAKPSVSRQKVEVSVYMSGQTDWTITALKPSLTIPTGRENIPADDSPKTAKTRMFGGTAYFYDRNNKLIRQHPMQTPSFGSVLNTLTADAGYASPAARVAAKGIDVEDRIKKAKDKGARVTELSKTVVAIRSVVNRATIDPNNPYSGKNPLYSTVELIDRKNKTLIGATLYNERDKVISRVMHKYILTGDKDPQLEMSHQENYGTDNFGKEFVTITDSRFNDMTVVNHITKK